MIELLGIWVNADLIISVHVTPDNSVVVKWLEGSDVKQRSFLDTPGNAFRTRDLLVANIQKAKYGKSPVLGFKESCELAEKA